MIKLVSLSVRKTANFITAMGKTFYCRGEETFAGIVFL